MGDQFASTVLYIHTNHNNTNHANRFLNFKITKDEIKINS